MEVELSIAWGCDHCHRRGHTLALSSDDPQAIADRAAEAHAIAQPDCHAQHGPTGLRINATGRDVRTLWEM